ncbi:hypothetical protein JCM33374_g224 [Metschnikowia sp. JCM 33374]|nr:hypothetical protein JCM33374_g224 [Metschnikowia sp. JCM 33374]
MSFEDIEDKNGVRVTWNNIPKSKLQHHRNIAPLAALYTPLNIKSEVQCLDSSHMSRCRQCKAFLNPYVTVNQQTGDTWYCPFCQFGNRLGNNPGEYPPALNPDNSTVEYTTGREAKLPPIFFYVVDTCFEGEDVADAFEALCDSLSLSFSLLPSDSLVGLVSFGKHVQLHDLSEPGKSFTFNGSKDYTLEEVQKILGMNTPCVSANGTVNGWGQKFLQTIDIAEYNLTSIIESLTNNTFPHSAKKERACRATGSAVNVSALALQAILGKQFSAGGHILCFVGGAATYGPGKIVSLPLKEPMRSHRDIEKSKATLPNMSNGVAKVDTSLFKQAKTFYDKVAKLLISIGLSCNIFAGSYDQVGLYEMDRICVSTGGLVVMCDSFTTSMFRQSVIKFFKKQNDDPDGDLEMGLNSTLECRTTSDLQIQGLVGNASGLTMKKDKFVEASVSPQSIGQGNTNAWKLCSVNPQSTYAIFFEKQDSTQLGHAFVQFTFHYQHPSGELRLRVTTLPLAVIADSDSQNLEVGFDQEAALVAIARSAIEKLQSDSVSAKTSSYDESDLTKQLDKLLIEYCGRFSQYRKGDLSSFRLSNSFAMLPQFMYHLRRSQFIRVFNNSPDETSFVRHSLMHEDVTNSLIMIQPSLLSYDVDSYGVPDEDGVPFTEPEAVLLDSMSLGATKILLLDTFFQILIYHGSTVAQWRKANYHNMEGYEHFKEFLEAPKKEAMEVLVDRFPLPRFIDCDEGGSQARFLMAKLNPSTNYASNANSMFIQSGGQFDIMTDDTSLQSFMDSRIGSSLAENKNAMKRKLSILYDRENIEYKVDTVKLKRGDLGSSQKQPSSYVADNALVLSQPAALIIHSIWKNNLVYGSSMDVDNSNSGNFLFLFFLDAQGKEQIGYIRDIILQFTNTEAVFISSSLSPAEHDFSASIAFSNTEECKSLAREMRLLDPLGGGTYPLNYLVIIDPQMMIRFRISLRFAHCYGAYQRFGLHFANLHGLIEEYANFGSARENKKNH